MPTFIGIRPGEEKTADGIRLRVSDDGERAYFSGRQCGFAGGKWLDLASDHAVIWIDPGSEAIFIRRDGRKLHLGEFPAWVCRGTGKRPALAAMYNAAQFESAKVTSRKKRQASH